MWSEILNRILTAGDLAAAREAADRLEAALYKPPVAPGSDEAQTAVEEKMGQILAGTDAGARQAVIRELKEKLRQVKVLRLTLAVEPTARMLSQIGKRVKEMMGENVVVEWDVDGGIVGGAKVVWEGKYADYTVSSKLDKWWQEQEQMVKGLLAI